MIQTVGERADAWNDLDHLSSTAMLVVCTGPFLNVKINEFISLTKASISTTSLPPAPPRFADVFITWMCHHPCLTSLVKHLSEVSERPTAVSLSCEKQYVSPMVEHEYFNLNVSSLRLCHDLTVFLLLLFVQYLVEWRLK